jgi:hypothetical protein
MSIRYLHSLAYCRTIHNCQEVELAKLSNKGWMDNGYAIHTQKVILGHKTNGNL